jgi:hypothetical protein
LLSFYRKALLLHGEAGPMTDAFQPEQPARLPETFTGGEKKCDG